jgi:hypothetical protein
MPSAGMDDLFAAGQLTVADLRRMRQRFEPIDVGAERLKRDERLGLAVEALRRQMHARRWRTKGDYSARSIYRYLISIAPVRAKLTPEGLHVEASKREIADGAGISGRTVSRSIPILEDPAAPLLRRDNKGRDPKKRGAFVLLTGVHELARYCPQSRRGAPPEGNEGQEQEGFAPLFNAVYPIRGDSNALPSDAVPEMRWPTLAVSRERDEVRSGWKLTYTYQDRLAKKRQAILEALVEAGGELPVDLLLDKFGTQGEKRRPWDFKRRTLSPLINASRTVEIETVEGLDRHAVKREHTIHPGPAIVEIVETVEGPSVRLLEDWREALEEHRRLSGELDAARLQKQKHRRQSKAFRDSHRDEYDAQPGMRPIDDKRQSFAFHPKGCACRECNTRFGQWISLHVPGCACADCFTVRKEEQSVSVLPLPSRVAATAKARPDRDAAVIPMLREVEPQEIGAEVVPINPRSNPHDVVKPKTPLESSTRVGPSEDGRRLPPKVNSIYRHGPFCDCAWCEAPPITRYATARSDS